MTETTTLERPRRGNGKRDRALGPVLVSGTGWLDILASRASMWRTSRDT
jgi:hypothetical protein